MRLETPDFPSYRSNAAVVEFDLKTNVSWGNAWPPVITHIQASRHMSSTRLGGLLSWKGKYADGDCECRVP